MNPFWEPSLDISIRRDSRFEQAEGPAADAHSSYLGRSLGARQLWFSGLLIAIGFLTLAGRATSLQIMRGGSYRSLAEGNRVRVENIIAPRGLFYDRFGRQLAENAPSISLAFIPQDLPRTEDERRRIINELILAINVSAERLDNIWADLVSQKGSSAEPVVFATNLPLADGPRLTVLANDWPGVEIISHPLRAYSVIDEGVYSLSHLIGYVGAVTEKDLGDSDQSYTSSDIIGKNGLELYFDDVLRGKNGRRDVEINALGQEQQVLAEIAPTSGQNIWLTIDIDLQKAVEDALNLGLKRAGAKRGAAVVMDPRDGGIIAMASAPSYNANDFSRGLSVEEYARLVNNQDSPLFNRAIQGLYPSGSTIKPVIATAALSEGLITGSTKYLSVGGFYVGRSFFPDWKAGGHGLADVRRSLAESINTFFYIIGGGYDKSPGLGIDNIVKYAHLFGLGEKSGIDLPGEASGLVPAPEWKLAVKKTPWYIGDTYHVAIGQGDLLVTPLQVANYTAAIANDGTLYRPHFLLEASNDQGGSSRFQPFVMRRDLASPHNLMIVREGMRQAVTNGSAIGLADLPFSVFGKTGTAQGGGQLPYAWFTGSASFNSPQIVVTVVLENAGEGSTYAVPVARDIFLHWAERYLEN